MKNNQKEAFMTLAHALIVSDNVLSEEEHSMMRQYKQEMNLPFSYDESVGDVEDAIATFMQESSRVKKKIVFELVALAYTDGNYVEQERMLIDKIRTSLGLEDDFSVKCEPYISDLTKIYGKILEFVES